MLLRYTGTGSSRRREFSLSRALDKKDRGKQETVVRPMCSAGWCLPGPDPTCHPPGGATRAGLSESCESLRTGRRRSPRRNELPWPPPHRSPPRPTLVSLSSAASLGLPNRSYRRGGPCQGPRTSRTPARNYHIQFIFLSFLKKKKKVHFPLVLFGGEISISFTLTLFFCEGHLL